MSILSQIARLSNAKEEIAAAIKKYGVTVPDDATLDNLADKCLAIAAIVNVIVDHELSPTSTNAVENQAVYHAQQWRYRAMYAVDSWQDCSYEEKAHGMLYKQTVSLSPTDSIAPQITAESEFCGTASYPRSDDPDTDNSLAAATALINDGDNETDDGVVVTMVAEKPTCDVVVEWWLKT